MHPLKSQLGRAFPAKQKPKARKHTQGDGNANHKPTTNQKGKSQIMNFSGRINQMQLFYFILFRKADAFSIE